MQALWKVIIPGNPSGTSGFLLALTISIDDFAVTVFTIGNQDWKRFLPIFMPMPVSGWSDAGALSAVGRDFGDTGADYYY